jgi:hypothetical protein
VSETEQGHSALLPLAAAAARLGISPDALRMRIRRGKARGVKRGGRLFVALAGDPNGAVRSATEQSEQPGPGRFAPAAGPGPGVAADGPPAQALPVIVEFQKLELDRLLRDNTRLNQRFDQLMDELVHLREMQQREQVLRQQDQALRQQIQATLDRLSARPPLQGPPAEHLSPPGPAPGPPAPEPQDAWGRAAGAAAAAPEPGVETGAEAAEAAPGPEGPSRAASNAPATGRPGAPGVSSAPAAPADAAYAYGSDARPGEAPEALSAGAAELAGILKEIGESLQELEPAPRPSPGPSPGSSAEQAAAEPVPPVRAGPSDDRVSAEAGAWRDDDEARLLEILGRMGPSAEDRRSAARIMKRLLRGRGKPRPRDPES